MRQSDAEYTSGVDRLPSSSEIVTSYKDGSNEHYVSKGYYRSMVSRDTCHPLVLTDRYQVVALINSDNVFTCLPREVSLTRYGPGKKLNTLYI